ncbi:MAG: Lrp/AsnC family transcriptional regulator [Candidatus Bathyarchaeota archaeon]|nr:Lrp/AsnC family transcriptional regulator [Candidatus Bathyarchaeota archaeon]
MLKISELDSQILKYLLHDGRESFADIAKKCNVTKNKVWKRYNVMEKKGVIVGATLQVNFAILGYDALATLLVNIEAQQIDQVVKRIEQIKEVHAYRQYNTAYNLRGVAVLKDLSELDQVKEAIRRKMPTMGLKTYIWTGVKNIPQNLMLTQNQNMIDKSFETAEPVIPKREKEATIDELDRKIINKLTSNGREAFSGIARDIGTSTDTIVKRYHKLKNNGVIKVAIQIDLKRLGYHALLDFNIASVSSLNLSGIVESLENTPDIITITKTSGDYDLQVTAAIRNIEQMFTLQETIAKIPGVTIVETSARKLPTAWPTPLQYISTY